MKSRKIYVEIPHQKPPRVYWATDQELVDIAQEQEPEWLLESGLFDKTDVGNAKDALSHDLHAYHQFDSVREATEFYETHKKTHQALKVLSLLELLEH